MNNIQSRGHYSSLNMLVWNAAVDCVVVRIVCVMYRYCKATCVSDVNMVNQCALWCCWAWKNLSETETGHQAQDGRVLTM